MREKDTFLIGRAMQKMWKKSNSSLGNQLANPEELTNQKRHWALTHREEAKQRARLSPERCFEYFVVTGLPPDTDINQVHAELVRCAEDNEKSHRRHRGYQGYIGPSYPAEVLFVYPPTKKLEVANIAEFTFPDGVEPHALERTPSMSELNEVIYGQSHLNRDDQALVFLLNYPSPQPLWGVCVLIQEMVHRPPSVASYCSTPVTNPPLSKHLLAAPRAYCLLTHVPFFPLHFELLHSILAQERLDRIKDCVQELMTMQSPGAVIGRRGGHHRRTASSPLLRSPTAAKQGMWGAGSQHDDSGSDSEGHADVEDDQPRPTRTRAPTYSSTSPVPAAPRPQDLQTVQRAVSEGAVPKHEPALQHATRVQMSTEASVSEAPFLENPEAMKSKAESVPASLPSRQIVPVANPPAAPPDAPQVVADGPETLPVAAKARLFQAKAEQAATPPAAVHEAESTRPVLKRVSPTSTINPQWAKRPSESAPVEPSVGSNPRRVSPTSDNLQWGNNVVNVPASSIVQKKWVKVDGKWVQKEVKLDGASKPPSGKSDFPRPPSSRVDQRQTRGEPGSLQDARVDRERPTRVSEAKPDTGRQNYHFAAPLPHSRLHHEAMSLSDSHVLSAEDVGILRQVSENGEDELMLPMPPDPSLRHIGVDRVSGRKRADAVAKSRLSSENHSQTPTESGIRTEGRTVGFQIDEDGVDANNAESLNGSLPDAQVHEDAGNLRSDSYTGSEPDGHASSTGPSTPLPDDTTFSDALKVITSYYQASVPAPGEMLTFQPLEHLPSLHYRRPNLPPALANAAHHTHHDDVSTIVLEEEAGAISSWAAAALCRALSLDNVLALLVGLLLEKQIVVIHPNLGVLTAVVLAVVPLLRPLQWHSLLLPILPSSMLSFMDAPVPFIVGVQHKSPEVRQRASSLMRVNVYKDRVTMPSCPELPRRKQLAADMQEFYQRLARSETTGANRPVSAGQAAAAVGLCKVVRKYLESLFENLRAHTITDVQNTNEKISLLLKESFIDSFSSRERPFMKLFVNTSMFEVHSDTLLSNY
eukprot:jgi/Chlat1/5411/Chrsp35S05312